MMKICEPALQVSVAVYRRRGGMAIDNPIRLFRLDFRT
jgi:hypothetical protein